MFRFEFLVNPMDASDIFDARRGQALAEEAILGHNVDAHKRKHSTEPTCATNRMPLETYLRIFSRKNPVV
jgi:hypothetical protein